MQLFFVILHDAVPPTPEGRASLSGKLVERLKLDPAAVEQIFKTLPVIIRRNISQEDAEKYVRLLESLGASAEALPEVELASNAGDGSSSAATVQTESAPPANAPKPDETDSDDLSLSFDDQEEPHGEETQFSLPETPDMGEDDFSLDFSDKEAAEDPFSEASDTTAPFADDGPGFDDDGGASFEDAVAGASDFSFPSDDKPFDLESGGLSFSDAPPSEASTEQSESPEFDFIGEDTPSEIPETSEPEQVAGPTAESDPLDFSIPFTGDPPPPGEIWDQGISEHTVQADAQENVPAEASAEPPTFEYSNEPNAHAETESGFREPEDSRPASDVGFSPIADIAEESNPSGSNRLTSAMSDAAFGSADDGDHEGSDSTEPFDDVNISDELGNTDDEQGVPLVKLVGGFLVVGAALLFGLNALFPGPEEEMAEVTPSVDQEQIASMLKAQKEILSKKPDPAESQDPQEDVITDWSGELQENGVYTRVSLVTVNGSVAGMAIEIKTDDVGPPSDEEVMSGKYQPWLKRFYAKAVAPVPASETPDGSRRRLRGKGRAYLVYGLTRERAIFEILVSAPEAEDGEPLEGVWLIEEGELPDGEENILRRQGENSYAIRLSGRFSALPVVKAPQKAEESS